MLERRALPGESQAKAGAGAPSMCNLTRNWEKWQPADKPTREIRNCAKFDEELL